MNEGLGTGASSAERIGVPQPEHVRQLVRGNRRGERNEVLLVGRQAIRSRSQKPIDINLDCPAAGQVAEADALRDAAGNRAACA